MSLRWVESNESMSVLPNVGQTHPRTLLFWERIFSIWEKEPRSSAPFLRLSRGRFRREFIAFDGRISLAHAGKNPADLGGISASRAFFKVVSGAHGRNLFRECEGGRRSRRGPRNTTRTQYTTRANHSAQMVRTDTIVCATAKDCSYCILDPGMPPTCPSHNFLRRKKPPNLAFPVHLGPV